MDIIKKLEIQCSAEEHQDILIAYADRAGLDGIEQTSEGLVIHSDRASSIHAYVEEISMLPFVSPADIMLSEVPKENWNKQWESSFQPIRVGQFCGVRAGFHEVLTDVEHEIIINPELAFGTGHHETTYMMIDQMQEMDFKDKSVFDYGCGTAILAILAERIGAKPIYGIDIDEQAIKCAHDCLRLNDANYIRLDAGTIEDVQDTYDIILANINRNVLISTAEAIKALVAQDGLILLSGILREDLEMVLGKYQETGFSLKKTVKKREWCSVLMSVSS
jgi:ribosomal protein L11 methyltransferase